MRSVLHLIDSGTPADMLVQLAAIAGESETIASIGPPPPWPELPRRATAVRAPMMPVSVPRRLRLLASGARVIHAWSSRAARCGWALGRAGYPVVVSLPNVPPAQRVRRIKARASRQAFLLTVPTKAAKAALLRAGLAEKSLRVLPPAPVTVRDPGVRRKIRKELGLGPDQIVVAAPAQMEPDAGHKVAIWAWAIVRQMDDRLRLLIPGTGSIAQRVRFFARTTGYPGEILFTGRRFEPLDILVASDIAAFMAERDGGVTMLASAMAAGLPIAATAAPDIRELAPHGRAALLSRPGDPGRAAANLLRLLDEPSLAAELGQAAGRIARQRFGPDASRARLAEIYNQAASASSA